MVPLISMCMKFRRMARMKSSHECMRPDDAVRERRVHAGVAVDVVGVGAAPLQHEVVLPLEHRRTAGPGARATTPSSTRPAARGGAAPRGRRPAVAGNGGDVIVRPSSSSRATNSCQRSQIGHVRFTHDERLLGHREVPLVAGEPLAFDDGIETEVGERVLVLAVLVLRPTGEVRAHGVGGLGRERTSPSARYSSSITPTWSCTKSA